MLWVAEREALVSGIVPAARQTGQNVPRSHLLDARRIYRERQGRRGAILFARVAVHRALSGIIVANTRYARHV